MVDKPGAVQDHRGQGDADAAEQDRLLQRQWPEWKLEGSYDEKLTKARARPALLWTPNVKYARPAWLDNPGGLSSKRTSFTEKLTKLEAQLRRLHSPLTTSGAYTLSLNTLDSEAKAVFQKSLWFTVHMLQAVDANGLAYYKVGRSRSTNLGQRFNRYQMEMLAVEPRLSLVTVLEIHLLSSEFHAKRFEGRIHRLMFGYKPELLLGSRSKTREIYVAAALPYLTALFAETSAMSKNDFANELVSGSLTTRVFSGAVQGIPDDNTTEAEESDAE